MRAREHPSVSAAHQQRLATRRGCELSGPSASAASSWARLGELGEIGRDDLRGCEGGGCRGTAELRARWDLPGGD